MIKKLLTKRSLMDLLRLLSVFIFLSLSLSILSCSHEIQPEEFAEAEKAYIVFNFSNSFSDSENTHKSARSITSTFTPALFTNIVFSGSDGAGHTVSETAASFSELSGKQIYVDIGSWSFTLSADYGSGSNLEKYKATATSVTIQPGPNTVRMKLAADTSNSPSGHVYDPTEHPGSYLITVKFPADNVDRISLDIKDTNNNVIEQLEKTKPADFTGTGAKSINFSNDSLASGVYLINVNFYKLNRESSSSTDLYENISSWSEILTINPGVQSKGIITLPETQQVYNITYILNDGEWNPSYDGDIFLSYTEKGGDYLPGGGRANYITLPPEDAVLKDGNVFDGWYTDAACSPGAHVTSFNISDKENKTFYAKWQEAVFDLYISCDGSDDDYVDDARPYGDGTRSHPYKTITNTYSKFEDITAQRVDGSPACTVHVLTDYTGENAFTYGQGTDIANAKLRIIGAKGGTDGNAVTLTANLPGTPVTNAQSFIYLQQNQQYEISYVNLTTEKELEDNEDYCGYGAYNCSTGTTLTLKNSSIKHYCAQGTALNVSGIVYLDNVEITDNVAVSDPAKYSENDFWGCGVAVPDGTLHIKNKVVVKRNSTLKNDKTDLHCPWNVWIGKDDGSPVFNPIEIDGAITGSDIGVKLDKDIKTFSNNYVNAIGTTDPTTYFSSDAGFDIEKDADGEAAVVCNVYVNATGSSDTDPAYNGSSTKPFASISKAVEKITAINNSSLHATIYVTGMVPSNTKLDNTGVNTQLIAGSLTIEGTGSSSGLTGDTTEDGTILEISAPASITLKNLTFQDGKSSLSGGAFTYDGGKTVTIDNCIFTNNEAEKNGGALAISSSEVHVTNSQFTGNRVTGTTDDWGNGGAVYLNNSQMHIDESVTFTSNFASSCGGAIYITDNSDFIMDGGTIEGNGAFSKGGAVYIADHAHFIINSSSLIKDNGGLSHSTKGGAFYIDLNGELTMNSGTITGNAAWSGGAVYTKSSYTLNDGELTTNKRIVQENSYCLNSAGKVATLPVIQSEGTDKSLKDTLSLICGYSGNITSTIEVGISGNFNMKGGAITSTLSGGQDGAAVCLYADKNSDDSTIGAVAEFNMSGGTISGLNISQSGAVYMGAYPETGTSGYNLYFNMSGGSITDNTCSGLNGTGGVVVGTCGRFTMTGGEISGNKTKSTGGSGGVIVDSVSVSDWKPTITLGKANQISKIIIKDNVYTQSTSISTKKNLRLKNNSDVITIAGKLSTESEVGITKNFSTADFTTGFAANNPGVAPSEIFTSDNSNNITSQTDVEGKFDYGTVSVTPGFPGTYSCSYTYTKTSNSRKIKLSLRYSSGAQVPSSLINSLKVTLYETGEAIKTWTGTSTNNFSEALEFTYPSYLDDPTDTSFYVEVSIKPDTDATIAYSYDFHAVRIETVTGATFNSTTTLCADDSDRESSVFIANRNITICNLIASEHEVTQREYAQLMTYYGAATTGTETGQGGATTPYNINTTKGKGDNYPAYYVSWYEAIIYCNLLSKQKGLTPAYYIMVDGVRKTEIEDWRSLSDSNIEKDASGKYYYNSTSESTVLNGIKYDSTASGWRLPTQAEWEYLAREENFTDTEQKIYSGSDTIDSVAWYSGNSAVSGTKKTHEVCTKNANSIGLYDMSGNVWEWCWDWDGYISSTTSASGPESGYSRVIRGGSWIDAAVGCTIRYIDRVGSGGRRNDLGFRVVRTAP